MSGALLSGLYRLLGALVVGGFRVAALLPAGGSASNDGERALRIRERLGRWQGGAPAGDWVWIHAASVGEARMATALGAELARALAGQAAVEFVITCQTPTGCRTARAGGGGNVHYFPVDAVPVVRPLLKSGRLRLYVSIETELWPALLGELAAAGVPTAIANARISEASMHRYRWVRSLFVRSLGTLAAVCARDEASARRLVELGVPQAAVVVTGDMKFDLASDGKPTREPLIAVDPARPLVVAGSTHEGEEEIVLDAFVRLRATRPLVRLALVPRHPERGAQVASAAASRGLAVAQWSACEGQAGATGAAGACAADGSWNVLVVDRIGLLRAALAGAASAFLGGSLLPGPGGHNLVELIAEDLRAITGPCLQNVAEQLELLAGADAAVVVRDAASLAEAWNADLADPQAAREAAARGKAALAAKRGATAATVRILAPLVMATGVAGRAAGPVASRAAGSGEREVRP